MDTIDPKPGPLRRVVSKIIDGREEEVVETRDPIAADHWDATRWGTLSRKGTHR